MAVDCTKSVPDIGRKLRLQIAFLPAGCKQPIHKLRTDIPKMGDKPLDNCEF
jgi:hypothetical protein